MQPSVEKIWVSAQESLRSMLNPDIYNLWFQPVKALALEGDTIVLEVADDFCECPRDRLEFSRPVGLFVWSS